MNHETYTGKVEETSSAVEELKTKKVSKKKAEDKE